METELQLHGNRKLWRIKNYSLKEVVSRNRILSWRNKTLEFVDFVVIDGPSEYSIYGQKKMKTKIETF